ncbi:MAG: DUF4350 domain-containing protein [Calothrix sp. C42_A2020_038]|nr:DUF4350 domain-containing protein [Calothrix sp. C42_A2020_038]
MKRPNRLIILAGIVFTVLILLTLVAAPSGGRLNNGSTYNRAPEGYGAWYSYMQRSGAKIERWQRPSKDIESQKELITFLQVNPLPETNTLAEYELQKWVEKGNNLVILGVRDRATAAQFSTNHQTSAGKVKIDTTRRFRESLKPSEKIKPKVAAPTKQEVEPLLKDSFGLIVWQKQYGKGKVIYSITSHLAANAYQNERGNFAYLSQLVSDNNKRKIYVDEYLHGYKDKDIKKAQGEGDLFSYFIQKPIFAALIQAGVLLIVLVFGQRRFGKLATIQTPSLDNSQAYIQALAAVLQKADSSDFVVDMIGKEELLQLQQSLGLGNKNTITSDREDLLRAWQNKFGTSSDLETALELQSQKLQAQKRRLSEKALLTWLKTWKNLQSRAREATKNS